MLVIYKCSLGYCSYLLALSMKLQLFLGNLLRYFNHLRALSKISQLFISTLYNITVFIDLHQILAIY